MTDSVVIIGAGPTGLGAAWRLHDAGHDPFRILEQRDWPGGLAASFVDEQGFTWDIGGHVRFSHYNLFDRVLDEALADGWLEHERESWIWIRDRFVPYPFQYNIHRLDPPERDEALRGLEAVSQRPKEGLASNFEGWILDTFGEGIARIFLFPYNFKVWGYPLDQLDSDWMGERVAVPDLDRVRENIRLSRDDVSWGPNSRFRFPLRGGTGAIWRAISEQIPSDKLDLGAAVSRIDADRREIVLDDGRQIPYDHLISTMPLDRLCQCLEPADPDLLELSKRLIFGSTHILGIGLRGGQPESLQTKCWMYFPESSSPYYRVTVFSNYSPHNVPPGEGNWSLMAEVTETPYKNVDSEGLSDRTISSLRRDGLIGESSEVVSVWHHQERRGYPTPFLGRGATLEKMRKTLEGKGIYSRGRFGAWRYEVSNQDHSFMQGVEVVDRILGLAKDEPTLDQSEAVNQGLFRDERHSYRA